MSKIEIQQDVIAEKLDEMADLSEYWKRNRDKGKTPNSIRAAMVMLADEIILLIQYDPYSVVNKIVERQQEVSQHWFGEISKLVDDLSRSHAENLQRIQTETDAFRNALTLDFDNDQNKS